MKLNDDKTKYMVINYCSSMQYNTRLYLESSLLEQVTQTKLLGVIISDDLTWHANSASIVSKALKRMLMLRKLCEFKVSSQDLLHIYTLYIRSVLEQSCVVWASSITQQEILNIERVQKITLRIILKDNYISYENALSTTKLATLSQRRQKLMLNFALKCVKNSKTTNMFPKNEKKTTRSKEIFKIPYANTERFKKSAIPAMSRLLNVHAAETQT